MLRITDRSPKFCDGLDRRTVLTAGGLSALGALRGPQSWASELSAIRSAHPRARRCILLFLLGGPPQHSTWDPKPDAPAEVRGEIGSIETRIPGVRVGELMPQTAQWVDRMAILRAVVTADNAHSSSGYYMMTGVPHSPMNRENANPGPPNDWPTMSAVVQHLARGGRLLPPSIRLPHHIFNTDGSVWPGQDSGWLGAAADPWLFNCEPAAADFRVPQFQLSADVTLNRLGQRRRLLEQLDQQMRQAETGRALDSYALQQTQAFDLLSSKSARAACDLSLESQAVRDRYGASQFGQSVLLGRRLLEADVEFVQVNWFRGPDEPPVAPCWDSHANETKRLRENLIPPFDQAYSALLEELDQRGMLDETLVVCMAEFGRTPRFNARAGRDHWGHVFSISLAGGGIQPGVVHGRSDAQAAYPVEGIVKPQDITATLFDRLGFTPQAELHDALGRPYPLSRGEVIREIV